MLDNVTAVGNVFLKLLYNVAENQFSFVGYVHGSL